MTKASPPPRRRVPGPRPELDQPAWLTGATALFIYFGLALLFFLPALLPGQGIFGTDYLAGTVPIHELIAEQFRSGRLPTWIPHVFGGLPLFANPGSAFYPVWLMAALLFPVARAFPIVFIVQFTLAGIGLYLLLGELGARRWVAFLAGLAFQFTGITMSTVYGGHDGRAIVATLAPLFLFFLHRTVRTGRLAPAAGAAATLGFSLLSFQIQSNYYLLLAGLLWGIFCLAALGIRGPALPRRLALGFGAVVVAFALASVNFLPFLDYVDASPRGGEGRGWEYATSWAMAPSELASLAVPEWQGASVADPNTGEALFPPYRGHNPFKLHTEYVGAFVLLLLALGAWYCRRDRYWWFFLGLGAFALSIAFGGHTPIYRLYYELLPGTSRFRAPSIAFFLVPLALAAMAGLTLERLARLGSDPNARRRAGTRGIDASADPRIARWIAVGGVAVGVLFLLLAGAGAGAERAGGFARFGLFLGLTAGLLTLWLTDRLRPPVLVLGLALVTVADLWVVGRRFFHTVPPPRVWYQADDVVHAIRDRPEDGRVWVLPVGPQYRGTGNYLMSHGIHMAGGEHGNALLPWLEYVGAGEVVYADWHNFLGENPNFRHAASIRWIVSMVRLEGAPQFAGARLIHGGPSALVYEDPDALPRAYLVGSARLADPGGALAILGDPAFDPRQEVVLYDPPAVQPAGGEVTGEARITEYATGEVRVAVTADRPSLLVLTDNYYPGWQARLNGEPAPVLRANHAMRAVALPAGSHEIVFRFRPRDFYIGFGIYVAGLLILGVYGAWLGVRRPRAGEERAE
jgi:hypothetical protein